MKKKQPAMKCGECGHANDIVFMHCNSCFQKHEVSGDMEVQVNQSEGIIQGNCYNCGKMVFRFKLGSGSYEIPK